MTPLVSRLVAALLLLALGTSAPPVSAAPISTDPSPPSCMATNTSTGASGSDLQSVINDASAGDVLRVRGLCGRGFRGGIQFDRDITLVGPATLSGETCVESGCFAEHMVVNVNAGTVKLKKLTITDGYSTYLGGGIYNSGTVILSSTDVRGNWAEDGGGGIYNEGTVVMNWTSSVTDNWLLFGDGGGILNHGTLIMNGSSRIERNSAVNGGGVYSDGTVVLNRAATITDNDANFDGGGLSNDGGRVWFSPRWHGTLCDNTPDDWPAC